MSGSDGVARTLALLADAPPGADVALLLRHAERGAIPTGSYGNDVALTTEGVAAARRLGSGLASRRPVSILTSPVLRCVQTAEAIIAGAGWDAVSAPNRLLGGPGAFVVEPDRFGPRFLEMGARRIVERQLADDAPPGMRPTGEGARLLLELMTPAAKAGGRLSLFVTHDIVLAALVGSLYGLGVGGFDWPDYLDGLALWRDSDGLRFRWRGLDEGSYPVGGQGDGVAG